MKNSDRNTHARVHTADCQAEETFALCASFLQLSEKRRRKIPTTKTAPRLNDVPLRSIPMGTLSPHCDSGGRLG